MFGCVGDHDGQVELLVLLNELLRWYFVYVYTRTIVPVISRVQIEPFRIVVLLPFRCEAGGEFWVGEEMNRLPFTFLCVRFSNL